MPEPITSREGGIDPEHEALLAESVGLWLFVVREKLEHAERLAFVLHDMFAVPFDEIAPIVGRSPTAARLLASRARRPVDGVAFVSDPDIHGQRIIGVDAFLTAMRAGDFDGLVAVFDPDVVVRAESEGGEAIRGARSWAEGALAFAQQAKFMQPRWWTERRASYSLPVAD